MSTLWTLDKSHNLSLFCHYFVKLSRIFTFYSKTKSYTLLSLMVDIVEILVYFANKMPGTPWKSYIFMDLTQEKHLFLHVHMIPQNVHQNNSKIGSFWQQRWEKFNANCMQLMHFERFLAIYFTIFIIQIHTVWRVPGCLCLVCRDPLSSSSICCKDTVPWRKNIQMWHS